MNPAEIQQFAQTVVDIRRVIVGKREAIDLLWWRCCA